jgi:hypothetical protein
VSLGGFDEPTAFEARSGPHKATSWGAFTARRHVQADSTIVKTMANAATALPALLMTLVPRRTVAKIDSMGFVVHFTSPQGVV